VEITRFRFGVSIYSFSSPPLEATNLKSNKIELIEVYSQKIMVELTADNTKVNCINVSTHSLWEVDKIHFALLETFWLKIRQHWMKAVSILDVNTAKLDLSNVQLEYSSHGQLQLR
jgi:hypothetical protein